MYKEENIKKKIGKIVFVLAAAGTLVSFSKLKINEMIQADATEVTKTEEKSIYTEEYQDSIEKQFLFCWLEEVTFIKAF